MQRLVDIWPLLMTALGFIVWLVRLEGKIFHNKEISEQRLNEVEKRVATLQVKHDALDSKIVDQLSEVRESLARLEGALGVSHKD